MPVLKVKKNGLWEWVDGVSGHTHTKSDITDFPTKLPANGGNADTVDGKHASDFAAASDLKDLQDKVGDTAVSKQISIAIAKTIPEVSETDNGKFLRVVNGTWVAAFIPNAEEASF